LNFLKRAGAIFMLLAIFASSCNKYADDFDQINTKLDALAVSVAGVAQLTTDMAALKSQVTALQTSVAALPTKAQMDAGFAGVATQLTAITGKIDAITATLATVATTGTATKAVVDKLAIDLAALSAKVAADDAAIALQLTGLAADNVSMKASLETIKTANLALAAQITAVQDQLTALVGAGGTDATALTIQGLQLLLKEQQITLDKLLANSNMYFGNVNITSDAEVDFWLPKIGVWKDGGMVNGTFTVDATTITKLTDLKTITDNILAVIGGLPSTTTITSKAGSVLSFAKLASTTGNVIITTKAANGEVSLPALTTVGGNYSVAGYDVDDAVLATVTGNVTLDYDGGYNQPALASAANVYLNDYKTQVAPATVYAGTLAVDFSGLTTVTNIQTLAAVIGAKGQTAADAGAVNTLTLQSATNITTGAGAKVVKVVAPSALTIALNFVGNTGTNTLASLDVTAAAATSVTAKAAKIAGALSIVAKTTGSTVALPNLTAVGGTTNITAVTLTAPVVATLTGAANLVKTTPVSLPALTSAPAGITVADAVTFAAPVYAVTPAAGLTIGAVTTSVEVASTTGAATSLNGATAALVTLTVNALTEALVTPVSVKTLTVTGKDFADLVAFTASAQSVTATSNTLVTATLGGYIKTATVQSTGLTALHTSGVVNSLTVNGCTNAALTSLDLQHKHYPSGPGSVLVITGNTSLTALTTSTDYAKTLTITGNTSLATLILTSYVNPLTVAGAAYTINTNALTGGYVASKASQGTDPFVEASILSNVLLPELLILSIPML